jgi:hypothetical protein
MAVKYCSMVVIYCIILTLEKGGSKLLQSFYIILTCGQCYKTFYGRKLRLFIIS